MDWQEDLRAMSEAFSSAFRDMNFARAVVIVFVAAVLIGTVADVLRPRVYVLPSGEEAYER